MKKTFKIGIWNPNEKNINILGEFETINQIASAISTNIDNIDDFIKNNGIIYFYLPNKLITFYDYNTNINIVDFINGIFYDEY